MSHKKGKIIIIGTGTNGGLKGLTIESYYKLMGADEIYCRIDYDQIIEELKRKGKKVISLTSFYEKSNSFKKVYENMANLLIKEARCGKKITYLVPGHPFVCEYPTELIIKKAKLSDLNVEILPAVSFLDSVFIDAKFDPGVGIQFIAASELFREEIYKSISPCFTCIIACISNKLQRGKKKTVYEMFIQFLNDKYNKDQPLMIVYQEFSNQKLILTKVRDVENYKDVLTTLRATCLIFPQKRLKSLPGC